MLYVRVNNTYNQKNGLETQAKALMTSVIRLEEMCPLALHVALKVLPKHLMLFFSPICSLEKSEKSIAAQTLPFLFEM